MKEKRHVTAVEFLGIASFLVSLKNSCEELEIQRMKLGTHRCPKDLLRMCQGSFSPQMVVEYIHISPRVFLHTI